MDRRGFLASAAALASWPLVARAEVDDLRSAAREAWLYGLPLVEIARLRAGMIGAAGEGPALNGFLHSRSPAGAGNRNLTGPEPDVLYSHAWINVDAGVAKISVPQVSDRYFSLVLLDMYSNAIKLIGGGRAGEGAGEYTIVGPPARMGVAGYTLPEPRMPPLHKAIHVNDPWIWALARTEVRGPDDLDAARAVQDGLGIKVKSVRRTPAPGVALDAAWGDYFYAVQKLIEESPPPPYEDPFFRRIALLQLGMMGGFEGARFADADINQAIAGVGDARTWASDLKAPADAAGGWVWPKPVLGDFGQDFLYRAQTSLTGLGSLAPTEVLCLRAMAPDGNLAFSSAAHFRLTLPTPPPADGFWSLTLYEVTPDGQLFLTDNPAGRYAIGSHTPGLLRHPDGGLDIWIGRSDPGGSHTPNWLPAPAQGPFALVLRAYLPGVDFTTRRYAPPPVQLLTAPPQQG